MAMITEVLFGDPPPKPGNAMTALEAMGAKGRTTLRRGAIGDNALRIAPWTFEFKPKTTGARLERAYMGALETIDAFEDIAKVTRSSGKFTDAGALHEIGNHALKQAMPALHRNREAIKRARGEVGELRAKVRLPDLDKTDSVGYLRRLEIRGHLAGMKDDARKAFISHNREKLDPEWVRAIVEMAPIMSGMMETDHSWFLDRELRRVHGDVVDEVKALEQALDVTNDVTELARRDICRELGVLPGALPTKANMTHLPRPRDLANPFDPVPGTALYQAQFDDLADVFEALHDAPYLKRDTDHNGQPVVRVLKNNSWALATEDEEQRGIFYKTFADYENRRAA